MRPRGPYGGPSLAECRRPAAGYRIREPVTNLPIVSSVSSDKSDLATRDTLSCRPAVAGRKRMSEYVLVHSRIESSMNNGVGRPQLSMRKPAEPARLERRLIR